METMTYGMKFDLIISNPPYNQNLDLKILNQIYELSDRICFVHPAGWLYDNKNIHKLIIKTKSLVKSDFTSYEKVENANDVFGIYMFTDIFITFFNKGHLLVDMDEIDIHGSSAIYKSVKHKLKIFCKNDNLHNHIVINKDKKDIYQHFVGLPGIRGHIGSDDFYTLVGRDDIYTVKRIMIQVDSTQNKLNLVNFLKLKFTRFCLSILKRGGNLGSGELALIPWFDFTKSWTDEDCAKELGITNEELLWMIQQIPNYYPEDEEKYKKLENKLK